MSVISIMGDAITIVLTQTVATIAAVYLMDMNWVMMTTPVMVSALYV